MNSPRSRSKKNKSPEYRQISEVEENVNVYFKDIHPIYHDSELYNNMLENNPEDDEVIKIRFYRNEFSYYNTRELINLFKLLGFWGFDELPEYFVDFIKKNKTAVVKKISEDEHNISLIEYYLENLIKIYLEDLSMENSIVIMKYLHDMLDDKKYERILNKLTNKIKTYIIDNFSDSFNFFLAKIDKNIKNEIKYTTLFLDLVTKDYIDYNSSEYYEITDNNITKKHGWKIENDFDFTVFSNELFLEILPKIDLNFKINYKFLHLENYEKNFLHEKFKDNKFTMYEYFLLSMQFSNRYITENFIYSDIDDLVKPSIYNVIRYFENNSQIKLKMQKLFYLFPENILNDNASEKEDIVDFANILGKIIRILLKFDEKYYLPLLNNYINWDNIDPIYWEDGGTIKEYIKYSYINSTI